MNLHNRKNKKFQRGHVESYIGMIIIGIFLGTIPPLISIVFPETHESIKQWFDTGNFIIRIIKELLVICFIIFFIPIGGIVLGAFLRIR